MTIHYRPWGPLQWLLPRLPHRAWTLVGVLGTEDRCTATLASTPPEAISQRHFLHIHDPAPSPIEAFQARYEKIRRRLQELGLRDDDIRPAELLADIDTMADEVERILSRATPHLILDITSMPKWWFFPLIRMLMASGKLETLVATYASARDYGRQLSSDPAPLAPLPTFSEPPDRDRNQELIVGIGFAALSLRELYSADADKIRYLFPFPPGPPNFLRNWEFLRVLETEIENRSMEEEDRWYVHMYDCPHIFEALRNFTRDGTRTTALAPFGPKTLSLAMCVFALAASKAGRPPVHVFYTQPRRYDLDYSTGIAEIDGVPDVKGYCLVIDGTDVYGL